MKSVAGALTDLLKTNGTGTAANNSAIIGTIKDLLEKNMKGADGLWSQVNRYHDKHKGEEGCRI